ncbi:MAG: hypothetical protein E4G90_10120 [Gemmatimonadales bacterium]|nr:MAG: hypothetical protein E4G90_10120 [Gemmatimonadales bacterium]
MTNHSSLTWPGQVLAAHLRLDAESGPWQGTTSTCRSCERETIEHLEDGWCSQCNGTTPDDTEQRRVARVELYQRTAAKCRKWGDTEGAAWFETRAKGGSE